MSENHSEDHYFTILTEAQGEYKEKGSKFIGYVFPCDDVSDFEDRLTQIKKEHIKSRHACYAYRLGYTGETYRHNDDGEPSGTAGKPIYGQLIKHDLTFCGAVVIRYFGGTKLGASGLITAYKAATVEAIAKADIQRIMITNDLHIAFDYGQMGKIMQIVKQLNLEMTDTDFTSEPNLTCSVLRSQSEHERKRFLAAFLGRSVEDIVGDESLDGCEISILDQNK